MDRALAEIEERKQAQAALSQKTEELKQRNFEVTELSKMSGFLQVCLTIEEAYKAIPLTGLFNRRYMEAFFAWEIHRAMRKKVSLGIIMLDVDHFKRFNDTFGHDAGDTVLRELGKFLQHCIRNSDIACRYGGEELLLILPEANLENTTERAKQINQAIKELKVLHNGKALDRITSSIGVACFPKHGDSVEAVIRAADMALYQGKNTGRDRVVVAWRREGGEGEFSLVPRLCRLQPGNAPRRDAIYRVSTASCQEARSFTGGRATRAPVPTERETRKTRERNPVSGGFWS